MENILIYAPARSGTSRLTVALKQALGLKKKDVAFEPFKPRRRKNFPGSDLAGQVAAIYDRHGLVKHLWNQVPPDENKAIVTAPAVDKIIFLYRRALFAQAMSRRLSVTTGQWGRLGDARKTTCFIRPDEVETQIQFFLYSLEYNLRLVMAAPAPVCVVCYEHLYHSRAVVRRQVINRLSAFLTQHLSVGHMMNHTSPDNKYKPADHYWQAVENYADLVRKFRHWDDFLNKYPDLLPESIMEGDHANG